MWPKKNSANTIEFLLMCVCFLITCKPLKAQEESLPKVDYVTPIKHNELPLSDDENESKSFSGNFRHKTSKVWDSNPNYSFEAFGQPLYLVLKQDSSFISKEIFGVFDHFDSHTVKKDLAIEDYLNCFYNGYVKGDNQSSVAVSLCHGMIGHIKTSFGSLLIQPANNQADFKANNSTSTTTKILHKIWQHTTPTVRHAVPAPYPDLEQNQLSSKPKLQRKKRNAGTKSLTVELLVAVDPTMKSYHGENVIPYILTLISIASNMYADPSIGKTVQLKLTNFIDVKRKRLYRNNNDALNDFCSSMKQTRHHFDVSMLLTRHKVCNMDKPGKCSVLGYAFESTICTNKACAIIHDSGLGTAFTIAHEIGHMFNMPHDDQYQCGGFHRRDGQIKKNLMNSVTSIEPWLWSNCSRHYFSEFIRNNDVSCLEDSPKSYLSNTDTRLPGQIYSLDQQCQLVYGHQYTISTINNVACQSLWCYNKVTRMSHTNYAPWAEGTPCKGSQNWCRMGRCVGRQ